MSTKQEDDMTSDDDAPIFNRRYRKTFSSSSFIPSRTRSGPAMTSTVASPNLPLTSDIFSKPSTTPQGKTAEQVLKKQLADAKKDLKWEKDDKLHIKKMRTAERKEIVALKEKIKALRGLLGEKDARFMHEQRERATLSRAYDELGRQLEEAKRNPGAHGTHLLRQLGEKEWEIERLRGELADNKNGGIQDLMKRLEGELLRSQAAAKTPGAAPKTADWGVEMGTQTDGDGAAERLAELKRQLRELA